MKIDSTTPKVEPARPEPLKQETAVAPAKEQAVTEKVSPVEKSVKTTKNNERVVVASAEDKIDVSSNASSYVKPDINPAPVSSGNYMDYTVNSDNDLIIKVRDKVTNQQTRQIPSEKYVAVKRAFNQLIARIFDKRV